MAKGSPVITLRLDRDTANWLDRFVKETGESRTDVVRGLVLALRGRRVFVSPEPFPLLVNDGSNPDFPVMVCHEPK